MAVGTRPQNERLTQGAEPGGKAAPVADFAGCNPLDLATMAIQRRQLPWDHVIQPFATRGRVEAMDEHRPLRAEGYTTHFGIELAAPSPSCGAGHAAIVPCMGMCAAQTVTQKTKLTCAPRRPQVSFTDMLREDGTNYLSSIIFSAIPRGTSRYSASSIEYWPRPWVAPRRAEE